MTNAIETTEMETEVSPTTANNESIRNCKELINQFGWEKEGRRNVVLIDGEKWSFSTTNKSPNYAECRQCYEDTVGFITMNTKSNKMYSHRVDDFDKYTVSRITSKGLKSHNVIKHVIECDVINEGIVR